MENCKEKKIERVCKKYSGFSGGRCDIPGCYQYFAGRRRFCSGCGFHAEAAGGQQSGCRLWERSPEDLFLEFQLRILHKPFIPIRKKGKLPCETVSVEYELEYGTATIEMHKDRSNRGQRVVIIDDLIATGGTNEAMVKLIEGLGGKVVKTVFLMELAGLNGRDRLEGYDVDAVITYPGK